MATFSTYPQTEFPLIYKCQAIAFMRCEWPFIFKGDLKYLTEPYPPDCDPVHFVAAEGESLLCYAAILRTIVIQNGKPYRVYGFGNMFTFPPYRQEGFGSTVFQMATEYILRSAVDIATLFCEAKLEPFYAKGGWQTINSATRIGNPSHYKPFESGSKMMLFVSEQGQRDRQIFENEPMYLEWTW